MKKSFLLFTVLVVLISTTVFTGCTELAEEFSGPKETWCQTTVTYKNTELNLAAIYVDEEYTGKGANTAKGKKYLSPSITLEPGITFVVWSEDGDNPLITELTEGLYFMKTFTKAGTEVNDDKEESEEEQKTPFKLKGTALNWTAIYLAVSDFRKPDMQDELPYAPDIITYKGEKDSTNLLEDPKNFSWKKLLQKILLQKALEKLM